MTREAQEAADELSKEGALVCWSGTGRSKVEPPHDCRKKIISHAIAELPGLPIKTAQGPKL